ncbi:uncharacterized protein LOC107774086 isoform X1 [Nicotiana tabacum]|uniref:Uncharacterized protein LOC107774086 isoform X1 n=2 Tax=Nicotiana TaxID=4085 RepID=A0A1S3YAJ6_TOBAC|nr:PREDICTED: uncharacterized protein LOC104217186 [Nicotiana sylvestris]XP_016449038.1 PREDICTED: uncharacterized protein LOC107774086 [Nicotiana tabacum]
MTEEEWLKAATMDDTVVAELLLRLNQVNPSPSKSKKTSLPLEWTVRQRRSRPISVNAKKPAPRASPTTPLSWSGATSVSGGGGGGSGCAVDGGCEESSGPPPTFKTPSSTRSKVNSTSDATTSKRSRKKKTLTELKEEEILLIKERKQLKKELALVRINLEKQRDTNQNLKRMKLDLHPQQANERGTPVACDGRSLGQYQQEVLPSNPIIPIFREKAANKVSILPSYLEEQQDVAALESKFVLPDLNIPFGEDSSTEILCG